MWSLSPCVLLPITTHLQGRHHHPPLPGGNALLASPSPPPSPSPSPPPPPLLLLQQSRRVAAQSAAARKRRDGGGGEEGLDERSYTKENEEEDERFMREALAEAAKAASKGEVPVGAVIVFQGDIIARAHNLVESNQDPTAHAEMICIRNAAKLLGGWRLLDSTLYVTLEPCPMCAGALLQARVSALVWGAPNTLLGADGSWVSLFPRLTSTSPNDGDDSKSYGKNCVHPFNCDVKVRRGVLASECSQIMKNFFRKRRKESFTVQHNKLIIPSYLAMKRKVIQNIASLFKFLNI